MRHHKLHSMKRLLALFIFAAGIAFAAEPTTLKEVFAQELAWRITDDQLDEFAPAGALRAKPTKESAKQFLTRIADGRSDADRKFAVRITQGNWATIESSVLSPAATVDAPKAKALRSTLERIKSAKSASTQDLTELRRILDSVPTR